MLVKVAFLYYWLISCLVSVVIYQVFKVFLYSFISDLFQSQNVPPQYWRSPFILFFLLTAFTLTLVILHIR